uniref:40S ribosomal protein S5 n=1 Tax=Trichogramma kaykai TaxID=54128 RepID=A0ABD2XNT1_9HYME
MSENWDAEVNAASNAVASAPAVHHADAMPEIKLFGKWASEDVQVNDMSLQDYISVKEKNARFLPHSAGRYAQKRFQSSSTHSK